MKKGKKYYRKLARSLEWLRIRDRKCIFDMGLRITRDHEARRRLESRLEDLNLLLTESERKLAQMKRAATRIFEKDCEKDKHIRALTERVAYFESRAK